MLLMMMMTMKKVMIIMLIMMVMMMMLFKGGDTAGSGFKAQYTFETEYQIPGELKIVQFMETFPLKCIFFCPNNLHEFLPNHGLMIPPHILYFLDQSTSLSTLQAPRGRGLATSPIALSVGLMEGSLSSLSSP